MKRITHKKEKAPISALTGSGVISPLTSSVYQRPGAFVKDFSKPVPRGRIENGVLIKKVRAENFFHKFQSWGVSQSVLESALEQGADYVEFRVDDGRRLKTSILRALNEGKPYQHRDYDLQLLLSESMLTRLDNPQLDLFEGVSV